MVAVDNRFLSAVDGGVQKLLDDNVNTNYFI